MEQHLTSSHAVIKALKGPDDHHTLGGPSKIEIAKKAWESTSIHFPCKDEVLSEWVLTSFMKNSKDIGGCSTEALVLDSEYWTLLNTILESSPSSQGARQSRTWLSALCTRVSILNIVTTFFKCASVVEQERLRDTIEPFGRSVHVIWPQAAIRMNLDALTDGLGTILQYFASKPGFINDLASVCLLITRTFKQTVGNTTSKKKAFSCFLEQSFLHWTHVVRLESSFPTVMNREAKLLISEVYQAGIDVFFCLDSLKSSNNPLEAILTDPKYSLLKTQASLYEVVPMLYRSYVQELRKHRHAIFGSGSSQAQEHTVHNKLRDAGMRAFSASYGSLKDAGDAPNVWGSVLALVEALEAANLVGYGLTERADALSDIVASSVRVLTEMKGSDIEKAETALRILCAVSRIDFDFFSPLLPDAFSAMITMNPSEYPSTLILLRIVLDFHSNTRTIPSYLSLLLEAFSFENAKCVSSGAPQAHQLCTAGVLLNLAHLEDLSRCIRNFLTPGQTQSTVDASLETLRDAWVHLEQDDTRLSTVDVKKDLAALRYSLIARAIAVILPSLPFSSLSEPVLASIRESISNFWATTLSEASRRTSVAAKSSGDDWASECASAATLRIRHALLVCPELCGSFLRPSSIPAAGGEARTIQPASMLPELFIELLGAFFDTDFMNASFEERRAIIDALIIYLEDNLHLCGHDSSIITLIWDGSSSSLNSIGPECHKRGALAIYHLLLDRWLPIIDEIASKEQLVRICKLIMAGANSSAPVTTNPDQISFEWASNRILSSASFWELHNIRDAIIFSIDSITQCARWEDFSQLLEQGPNSTPSAQTWTADRTQSVLVAFRLLLRAPREYLPRDARFDFVQRALVSDLAVSCSDPRDLLKDGAIVAIRTWIVSVVDTFDILDILSVNFQAYVEHLMTPFSEPDDTGNNDISVITLDLLTIIFRQTVRFAMQSKTDQFASLCELLRRLSSHSSEQARLRFIEILIVESPNADKVPASCIESVTELCSDMNMKYSDALSAMSVSVSMPEIKHEHALVVRSWRTCIMLQKWLNKKGTGMFGFQLVQKMMPVNRHPLSNDSEVRSFCTNVFLLLLEELDLLHSDKREKHIANTVAAYILFVGRLQLVDQFECDASIGRIFKLLSVTEFDRLLSLLFEAFDDGLGSNAETRAAVHLSSILLSDAPEGTMKVTQRHFEECLDLFCGDSNCTKGDPELTLEVLGFIGRVCSEKPAYLRHSALGSIWLLLVKILTGSTTHVQETCPAILHSITSTAGSLIRLRRDLVTYTLPHLGMVLTSLIRSLRAPQAQLGARHRTQVADTLPWWISPSAPLGVSEARAVARLLTSLQAKTIPRTFSSRDKSKSREKERPAESLLGAFSKHAAPVLGVYINMLVDPLVAVDSSIREALAPGLYALCDAMGERGRDALMVSGCDAAGKTVLKVLWRDYDKQRYVGKG